jgi:LysM repeat protein
MSLQEAASSGSFNPRAAQPSDPQRVELPFHPPGVDDSVDHTMADSPSPFANPYDFSASPEEAMVDGGEPDMRATRRRAWTVIGLAVVIPAAVAGVIAWQLFGSDAEPVPTVTRVTTTAAEPAATQIETATPTPAAVSVSATTETPAPVSNTQTAAVAASTGATAAGAESSEAAVAGEEPQVDLSSLDPAARLAAWTNIETIQVLPGETLWLIAQNYNTTISAIAMLNGISDPTTLSIGQQLAIPVGFVEEIVETPTVVSEATDSVSTDGGSVSITAAATEAPALTDDLTNWHTIAPVLIEEGDSLAAIAEANNTTVEALMALNGIADPNLILVGDTIQVPVGYQGDAGVSVPTEQQTQMVSSAETTTTESTDEMLEEEDASTSAGDEEGMMEE